jgi:preprotein translocase subunit SecB
MTDSTNGKSSAAPAAEQKGSAPAQVQIAAQYIKDLSFENPNIEELIDNPGDNPSMQLEVNVNARRVGEDLYESAIDFKAHASNQKGTIYQLELIYAGLFRLKNIPSEALEPFLLINCPTLIFPYLRRLVSDLTREGGFPPLLLDPIDFGALFMRRKQEAAAKAGGADALTPKGNA